MKVLDSDTCIAILRGRTEVIDRRAAEPDPDVVTTWFTAAELSYGAARSSNPGGNALAVAQFLRTLDVLAPDLAAARIFGDVRAHLRARGDLVPDADLWIASVALARGAAVVTGNGSHFRRVPGLPVEDWIGAGGR